MKKILIYLFFPYISTLVHEKYYHLCLIEETICPAEPAVFLYILLYLCLSTLSEVFLYDVLREYVFIHVYE